MINTFIFEKMIYITIFQLWWVAVWGISYLVIEYLAKKSKKIELYIYIGLLIGVISLLMANPKLMVHMI